MLVQWVYARPSGALQPLARYRTPTVQASPFARPGFLCKHIRQERLIECRAP